MIRIGKLEYGRIKLPPNQALDRTRLPAAKKPCRRFPTPRGAAAETSYYGSANTASRSAPVIAAPLGAHSHSKDMNKNQRAFFIGMGIFQILVISVMAGWMLIDAYKAITSISQQPIGQFLSEPILWHKIGEILVVFPVGIAFAAFYIFWKPNLRLKYLRITTPLMIIGGVLNLIAAWGFYQKPKSDFNNFMIIFGPILFIGGLILPFLLRWVHIKRTRLEDKMNK